MSIQDPRLKCASNEILQVLKKYDVGGAIFLADGETHGEYRLSVDTPTWSMIRFVKGQQVIHLKAHAKSKPFETNKTINSLFVLRDMLGGCFMGLDSLIKRTQELMNIEVGEGEWEHRDGDE